MRWITIVLFFCFIVRSCLGEIEEGKSMMASSSFSLPLDDVHILILTSLIIKTNNSSVNKTVVQASNLSEKLSKAAVTAATTAALFASVRFFFLCSFGLVLRRVVLNGDKKTLRAFEEEEEERFSQIVSLSLFFVVISRARLKSLWRHSSSSSSFWETTEEEKTLRWWWERFERDPRRENEEGKSFKNRISSRFALISKFIFGPKRSQKTWGKEEQGEFFFSREFLVEPTTTTPTKEMSFEKRELTFPSLFLPFNFFLLKTW